MTNVIEFTNIICKIVENKAQKYVRFVLFCFCVFVCFCFVLFFVSGLFNNNVYNYFYLTCSFYCIDLVTTVLPSYSRQSMTC